LGASIKAYKIVVLILLTKLSTENVGNFT